MPMNEELRKAVERMTANMYDPGCVAYMDAQTIRAELTRLTEIADSVDPLVVRLGEVTTKLEAANALLRDEATLLRAWARESREGGWSTHQVAPMNKRADEIQAHLSEPRT